MDGPKKDNPPKEDIAERYPLVVRRTQAQCWWIQIEKRMKTVAAFATTHW